MRKSLYALLALIVINSSSVVANNPVVKLDFGQSVSVAHPGLGKCEWSYDGSYFYVTHKGVMHEVDPLFLDKDLLGISKKDLLRFLQFGYLYINRLDNGEFTIKAKGRVKGGEPFTFALIGSMVFTGIISLARNASKPAAPARDFDFVDYHQAMVNHKAKEVKPMADKAPVPQKVVAQGKPEAIKIEKKEIPLENVIKHVNGREVIIQGSGHNIAILGGHTDERRVPSNRDVECHCVVGPGIPIGPIPFPHPRPPLIRIVKGMPTGPGKTFMA
jgi:hypothetical protein